MNEFGTSGEMETRSAEANGTVCTANTTSEEKPIEEKKNE